MNSIWNRESDTTKIVSHDRFFLLESYGHSPSIIFILSIRTLNQGGKLENLKIEMQKNDVSVLGVSEVRWKGQGKIRSGDYTVYYSGGERAERRVATVVHKI